MYENNKDENGAVRDPELIVSESGASSALSTYTSPMDIIRMVAKKGNVDHSNPLSLS